MAGFRRTILPTLFTLACLPLAGLFLGDDARKILAIAVLAGLVIIAHRRNLVEEFSHLAARRPPGS
jgi:hypothetical protein